MYTAFRMSHLATYHVLCRKVLRLGRLVGEVR